MEGEKKAKPRIIVCVPGQQFSGWFLDCWTSLFGKLLIHGFQTVLSREYTCTLPVVRHRCLGVSGKGGKRQSPFNGEYDYILWIDSDQTFTFDHFMVLYANMQMNPDIKVCSGYYAYNDMTGYALGYFEEEDKEYKHLEFDIRLVERDYMIRARSEKNLVTCDWSGLGFMLIRKGVFESIDYPYFAHPEFMLEKNLDVLGEDLYFGKKLKEAGIPIYVDPRVYLGHIKQRIIGGSLPLEGEQS